MIGVLIMRATTLKGDTPPFIMELPAYHKPQVKNLMFLIWDKAKHFIVKAFTIILASTIVIWFLMSFSFNWTYVGDDITQSILAQLGSFVQPIFTPLGFGSQLANWGWVFIVCALCGLIAKENVIAVMGTIAACIVSAIAEDETGVSYVSTMIAQTQISIPALLAFIAFNMTTIPCFAAVATAKAELKGKGKFVFTLLFWMSTSYIVGAMIYTIGSWWWTVFIWAIVIAITWLTIYTLNKNKQKKVK